MVGRLHNELKESTGMKIYGYSKDDEESLKEMNEITLQGSYDELIEVANFLIKYANVMKESGDTFEHAHLKDEHPKWKNAQPDIVIHK